MRFLKRMASFLKRMTLWVEGDTYLRCHSEQGQCKEKGIRSLQEQRFLEQIEDYKQKLSGNRKRTYKMQIEIVLRTNWNELSDTDIWSTYIMLTRLESAFRHMKSYLGFRPIFHQKEERTDAHLFISVMAYHLVHMIEHKLSLGNDTRSWWTIRKILQTHQSMILEYDELSDDDYWKRHHVTLCSEPEHAHKLIYKLLKIPPIPFKRHEKIYDKL